MDRVGGEGGGGGDSISDGHPLELAWWTQPPLQC